MEELPSSLYNKGQLRHRTVESFTTKSHTNSATEQGLEARFTECHYSASNYSESLGVCVAIDPKSVI